MDKNALLMSQVIEENRQTGSTQITTCYNKGKHFQRCVESMPRRVKAVLQAKEGPTLFYQCVPNKVVS